MCVCVYIYIRPTVLDIIPIYFTKSLVNKNDHQFVVCMNVVCLT